MRLKNMGERALWPTVLVVLLLGYLAAFSIINFIGLPWFLGADTYGDTLIARYIWEQKSLFPDGWVYGNQYYVVATPVLAALFYGLTGSMNTAMALATSAMTLFLLIALWWMLRPFLSRTQILAAEVALVSAALAMDLHYKLEAQLLFVMASYYACYLLTILVVWGDYLHGLFRGKPLLCISFPLGLALSLATGMQSLRQTCIMVLPLLAFEGLRVLAMLLGWVRRTWMPTVRALCVGAANVAGLLLIRALHVPATTIYGSVELLSPDQLPQQLRNAAVAIAQITGLSYVDTYGPAWFIALFSLASIAVVLLALWNSAYRWLRRRDEARENAPLDVLLALCVISLLAVLSSSLVLNIEIRSVYLFMWYMLVSLSAASLARRYGPVGRRLVMASLCVLSLFNLYASYAPNVRRSLQQPENLWSQVADELMNHDFEILYGRWEFANMVAGYTDGKVVSGAWYAPVYHPLGYINPQDLYAPEDNERAVYMIRPEELEEAMRVAEEQGAQLTLVRQFDGAALYTSSKQLMQPAPETP